MPRVAAQPGPGCFKVRLVKQGPWVAAKLDIIDGVCRCTINGEQRAPEETYRWVAEIGDAAYPLGPRIEQAEYDQMLAYVEWAEANAPDDPVLAPRQPLHLRRLKSLF